MSYRLYIDTSVVFGALFDDEDPDRVTLTGTVLRRLRVAPFEAFIGTPVLEEISIAPLGFVWRLKDTLKVCRRLLSKKDQRRSGWRMRTWRRGLSRYESVTMRGTSPLRPSPILTRLFLGTSAIWST